jgi:hypothetical protein
MYVFHKVSEPYPLYPLPLDKGKGKNIVREASPLFNSPHYLLLQKGEEILERGEAPFLSTLPFP